MGQNYGALKVTAPSAGAVTVGLTLPNGLSPTVYSNTGVTTTVGLPLTIAAGATQTVYFASPATLTYSALYGGRQIADETQRAVQIIEISAGQVCVRDYSGLKVASADGALTPTDVAANRPAATAGPGYWYSTDTGSLDYSDGSTWRTGVNKGVALYLDSYGADPTGVAASDAAFTAAYAAAVAAVASDDLKRAMIVLGSGKYKFTQGVVQITDPRIGFVGQGNGTVISGTGTGVVVYATNTNWAGNGYVPAAPVGGFVIDGSAMGAGSTGLRYGDRAHAHNPNIRCQNFSLAASRGYWFNSANGGLVESSGFTLQATACTVSYDFDGNNGGSPSSSFDYNDFDLTVVTSPLASVSPTVVKMNRNARIVGCLFKLRGNVESTSGQTCTVMQIGVGGTDASYFSANLMDIVVENVTGAGPVVDINVAAAALMNDNSGVLIANNIGNAFTAGTISGYAALSGLLKAPVIASTTGTLTKIGSQFWEWESGASTVLASFGQALTMDMTGGHLATPVTAGTPTSSGVTSGTANTVTVTGGDTAGTIQVVTPGSGVVTGTQATVTFHTVFAAAPKSVLIFPANAATAGVVANWFVPSPATTSAWILSAVAAPAISTTYLWRYLVLG